MKKFIAVFASFVIMLCLGGVYAWSFFVPLLKAQLGFTSTQAQWIIGTTIGVFAFSMLFAGPFERKFGPKRLTLIGAVCLFSGYYFAQFFGGNFLPTFLTISILAGIGTGCGYVSCLVVPAKNFPKNKGLAVGISVAGFGGGAIGLSYFAKSLLIQNPDLEVLDLLAYLGIIYGLVLLVFIPFLNYEKEPSLNSNQVQHVGSSQSIWSDFRYITIMVCMFCSSFAGLLVLGNLKPIILSMQFDDSIATFCISIYAFGNMAGRVLWGLILDKTGVGRTFYLSFVLLLISLLLLSYGAGSEVFLYLNILSIGFAYSATFVLFPLITAQIFGVERLGSLYPYVFLGYGFAGIIGPVIAGMLFDKFQNYIPAFYMSATVVLAGIFLYAFNARRLKATSE